MKQMPVKTDGLIIMQSVKTVQYLMLVTGSMTKKVDYQKSITMTKTEISSIPTLIMNMIIMDARSDTRKLQEMLHTLIPIHILKML